MLILALFLAGAAAQNGPLRADYTIRLTDPAGRRATVAIEFTNVPADATELELNFAERFAFTSFPQAQVLDPWIVVVGEKPSEIERTRPFMWRIPCAPGKSSAVVYNAPLDLRESPLVDADNEYEMPLVAEDFAMISCGALLPAPSASDVELRVRFEVPKGWAIHTPWPEVSPGVYAPRDALALQDTLVALGKWEVHEATIGGARTVAAFAPSEARFAGEVAPLLKALVMTELEMFGGAPLERYLFLFVPSRVRGFAGSAKQGAMVLSVGANTPASVVKSHAAHLVAHEFFHTWGASRYACPDELRFFNEGFTDYFAFEATRRIGTFSDAEFEATISAKLGAYERAAQATGVSLVEAGGPLFFEGKTAYEQIYSGGLVIAALCEKTLRSSKAEDKPQHSLDEFMRAFNNDKRWSRRGAAPTRADFLEQLSRFTSAEFATRLGALLDAPRADLSAALVEAGCKVERGVVPAPLEIRANLDSTRIVDIDPECAAARIGLVAGDKLLEVNGVRVAGPGDCHAAFAKPIDGRLRIRLQRAGAEQRIDAAIPTVESITFRWN